MVPQHGSQFVLHLLGTLQIMDWQITENTQLIILHTSECGQKGLEHLFLLSLLVLQYGSQFALHLLETLQIMYDWQITESTKLLVLHMFEYSQNNLEHLFSPS